MSGDQLILLRLYSIMRTRQVFLGVAYCILAQELESDFVARLAYLEYAIGKN